MRLFLDGLARVEEPAVMQVSLTKSARPGGVGPCEASVCPNNLDARQVDYTLDDKRRRNLCFGIL